MKKEEKKKQKKKMGAHNKFVVVAVMVVDDFPFGTFRCERKITESPNIFMWSMFLSNVPYFV